MQMKKHLFEKRIHAKDGEREEEKRRERERVPRGLFIFKLISNYRRYEGTRALPAAYQACEGKKRGKVRDQDSSLCSHVLSQFAVLPSVPLSRLDR